jgi:hypothetical protein
MNGLKAMVLICAPMEMVLPAFASTHYVSPTGNDSADGSAAVPWKTIQHAADRVVEGDTVIVHPGTYEEFVLALDFLQNGTPSSPILFVAEPGAIINHRDNKTADEINLEGAASNNNAYFRSMNLSGVRSSWTMVPAYTHKTPVLSSFYDIP